MRSLHITAHDLAARRDDEIVTAPGLSYREDIDGLRAVAVVPIVLYHAGMPGLSGGFIGVDIFFVISGYLITRIIMRELQEGRFSLLGFYRRRILRIFPALFAMLAIVFIVGIALMLPGEITLLARSGAAAAGSVSNFLFWQEQGYFVPSAETNPLLHTWSLGVEEQFYLLWPVTLLIAFRWASKWIGLLLWAVVVASLACGAALIALSENAAFYLLPGRAWELALGGVIAVGAIPDLKQSVARQIAVGAGAAMIALSYVFVRSDQPFPVPAAIPVCIGTGLLIAYGPGTMIARLLATGPLRAIGLISFSLYLWHWPIITFYRIETGLHFDGGETLALVLASFAAAAVSYVAVEKTFLSQGRSLSNGKIIAPGLAALAVFVAGGIFASHSASSLTRFSPEALGIADSANYREAEDFARQYGPEGCFIRNELRDRSEAKRRSDCENIVAGEKNFVLMGDSFAAQYASAMAARYSDVNWTYALASGCRPTLNGEGAVRCRAIMRRVYTDLLSTGEIDTVVIGGRWLEQDIPFLAASLRSIREAGAAPVLIGPSVEYDYNFPALVARDIDRSTKRLSYREIERPRILAQRARAIADGEQALYLDPLAAICGSGGCVRSDADGAPLHWDYGHLTLSGTQGLVAGWPELAGATVDDGGISQ